MMAEGYIKVAKLSDLKEGTLFPIIVDDEPVCLTLVEGTVYAFTDNCTHISGPLNEGEFENCVVTCPWHGARFDVRDGKVLRGPARQDLYTYPVKIDDEDISIYLPPES
jgi:nitrite reductase/ring-hydroxylating ferredoxin subunit